MNKHNINITFMRKIVFWTIMPFALLSVISCENESNEEHPVYNLIIPENAYSFTISSVNTDEETCVYIEPSFTDNFEKLGCSVKKIDYYIDNILASTEIEVPFLLEYSTSLLAKGQHIMKAVFTVGGKGFKDTTVEYKKTFIVSSSSPSSQSAIKFDIDYDHYLRVGDKLNVTINMTDRYNAGYRIKEVKYYFDEKLISTKKNEPFDLEYSPTLVEGQSYSLRVEISYSLGNTSTISYSLSTYISVIAANETRFLFNSGFSYGSHFNNGDVITGTGLLYRGAGDNLVYKLNIYWDDTLVGTSRNFPYGFNYTIRNAEKGIHHLKHEWRRYEKDGKTSIGGQLQSTTIIIDK